MGGPRGATGAGTRADVTLKISQLQNFCKRDPVGYREDYDAQTRRLEAELGLLRLQPNTAPGDRVVELIQFSAAVSSSSYKGEESDRIATMLMYLLGGTGKLSTDKKTSGKKQVAEEQVITTNTTDVLLLHRDVRKACVSALILMRNKGAVKPLDILELFFNVMAAVPDKALRELLYRHIVNDIRNINKKGKRDEKVNRSVQSFFHRIVQSGSSTGSDSREDIAAKRAVDMVCELYRRRVWTDDRTVAILASAVESDNPTVSSRAMRFFLGIEEKMAEDTRQQQEDLWHDKNSTIDYHLHSRKTCRRTRQTIRALKNRKKVQKKKEAIDDWMDENPDNDRGVEASRKLYPAIELLRDPQGLAEHIFRKMRSAGSAKYERKLLMINFVTRLIGNHELLLLPLYTFLQKYMGGHQRDVTCILAYTVQACHPAVPPDEIYGILKTIAHNFITERCSEEQMAVGINAVRAICARVPSAMSKEDEGVLSSTTGATVTMDMEAFSRDLAAYSNHRDRSVSIAGKAWTNFVREVHPALLQGKDRGLKGSALHRSGAKPLRYGEQKAASGVAGADLLLEYESKKAAAKKKRGDGSSNSDDSDQEEDYVMEEDSDDDKAPELVQLGSAAEETKDKDQVLDLSKLSQAQRDKLKADVSSSRIFSTAEFEKMRKLTEREERAKRDPREAARRKRAIAKGEEFDALSDSDSDDDELHVKGVVNPEDIMATATRKRQSKADKLEKIIGGRSKFEDKRRDGGSTNTEKKRKKNFIMSKFSAEARRKGRGKNNLQQKKREAPMKGTHDSKKRRRKH